MNKAEVKKNAIKENIKGVKNMKDYSCLAENYVVPASMEETGLNLNELVVGSTGCGKTFSVVYSRLLHTYNVSVVVPITKRVLKDKFKAVFESRGYTVIDLDMSTPDKSDYGYNPLDYVHSDEDIKQLANMIVECNTNMKKSGFDPYWYNSAETMLIAIIKLELLRSQYEGNRPLFSKVTEMVKDLSFITEAEANLINKNLENEGNESWFEKTLQTSLPKKRMCHTSLDIEFDILEKFMPGNEATKCWNSFGALPERTLGCIMQMLHAQVDKITSDNVVKMCTIENRVRFEEIGNKKTALFITTSAMNPAINSYINIMYAQLFKTLFERAEANELQRLKVPVHVICDDFACGGRIKQFPEYISVFRASGISVTILLQSETQLASMYEEKDATTIINNCDTYIYMGGMDIETCKHVAERLDKPLCRVLSMNADEVAVFRRGNAPVIAKRYQTKEDPLYKELIEGDGVTFKVWEEKEREAM